jgi:ABC-type branched-subunit amino acid transport system permease subunit
MDAFSFLPEMLQHATVAITGLFVGEGWHLTLGALFMIIVIFLPGGLMRWRKPKSVVTTEAEAAASE